MNQTGTDTPFEDGFKALGYSHYRKRIPERELTSTEFNRYDKTSTREVAFLGKDVVGSIRKYKNLEAQEQLKPDFGVVQTSRQ